MTITVFVAPTCPHSQALLADLERRRVPFRIVDVTASPELLVELERVSWDNRVPVVVDHERVTIGFGGRSTAVAAEGADGGRDPGGSAILPGRGGARIP